MYGNLPICLCFANIILTNISSYTVLLVSFIIMKLTVLVCIILAFPLTQAVSENRNLKLAGTSIKL